MSIIQGEVRSGTYHDSLVLMQLQRALAALPGVLDAGVVMATPANRELLAASDLWPPEAAQATPGDLLIIVKAESGAAAADALGQVDRLLQERRPTTSRDFRPRSLDSAARMLPQAQWVLVSVPGRYAADVAGRALALGKHVFLFSDNVSLVEEVALKETSRANGLLLMGPDCGTAILNGVGLGFANRVRRGRIGLVGASGTGLQAITSHVHRLGEGISQALGTGGRDLSPEVGGVTALQALDLLGRDLETNVIVLTSKPPAPEVAARLLGAARGTGKPIVVYFQGYPSTVARSGDSVYLARHASDAALLAVELLRRAPAAPGDRGSARGATGALQEGRLRALFSGGTLAYEALLGLRPALTPLYSNVLPTNVLYSNVSSPQAELLPDPWHSRGHTVLDLGADEFTQGRLHPMLDNALRLRRLRQEAADPEVVFILLDVVLGLGAHPDPAAELAPAIAAALAAAHRNGRPLAVAVILIGTDEDPQDLTAQAQRLAAAGALVFDDVTTAVEEVIRRLARADAGRQPAVPLAVLRAPLAAINVGLESFYDSLVAQGAPAVHVDWRPPAGGNDELTAILATLKAP